MSTAYLLWHVRDEDGQDEDVKMIGVYSSEKNAVSAAERMKLQPGFGDHPDGFHIDPYPMDQDHWTEGFVTL